MPPQQGLFAVPYGSAHKARTGYMAPDMGEVGPGGGGAGPVYAHHGHAGVAGPSSRGHVVDDGKKEKRKREIAGKLGKEMIDRREDGRYYHETVSQLHGMSVQLALRPETSSMYNLRLLPLSLERSAILSQCENEERYAIECAQTAYEEERDRVEEEWKKGRDRVRERLLEGIEERRRKAREEKEGEGAMGDATLDAHSRPPITRKLRNKLGTSPPPTPGPPVNGALISSLPITTGPFPNPHSLSVDEIPSPFPLPLTSTTSTNGSGAGSGAGNGGGGGGGRRRQKGGGAGQNQAIGGLGKSIAMLGMNKDSEADNDMIDIRRGNKRRRNAAATLGPKTS
ncbi:hypothetical protein AN958_09715 [Leucoagaricus sp. SymC.cos]|nr:hypothetical protein AN958_09715 [Leucoagaricus sp. SymC.cos]